MSTKTLGCIGLAAVLFAASQFALLQAGWIKRPAAAPASVVRFRCDKEAQTWAAFATSRVSVFNSTTVAARDMADDLLLSWRARGGKCP